MATKVRKEPRRTCVACREIRAKKDLIRLVRSPEGRVFVDPTGKANGRGAYICAREECFEKAFKDGKLVKALETTIDEATVAAIRHDFLELIDKKRAAYQD
ncbi:MAG: YlxR family protein [Actinobacteria bacterium]|nr:YlxR family protein [Actinomycetota bacterium]